MSWGTESEGKTKSLQEPCCANQMQTYHTVYFKMTLHQEHQGQENRMTHGGVLI